MTNSGYLVKSVIEEDITCERECIALNHTHMSVGIKGIGGFVEECTVAVHQYIVMTESHVTYQELRIGMYVIIEIETVRMQHVHPAVRSLSVPTASGSTLDGSHGSKQTYAQKCNQTCYIYSTNHSYFTHPGY